MIYLGGSQKTLVEGQGNETGKGRRSKEEKEVEERCVVKQVTCCGHLQGALGDQAERLLLSEPERQGPGGIHPASGTQNWLRAA